MKRNILTYVAFGIALLILSVCAVIGVVCDVVSKLVAIPVALLITIGVVFYRIITNNTIYFPWVLNLYNFAGNWKFKKNNYKVTSFLLRSVLN